MDKRAIWAIIGLMTAAVVGVVWLQMGLIRTAMQVNEDRFDKNVYNALNEVAKRLEEEEKTEALSSVNGYMITYFQKESSIYAADSAGANEDLAKLSKGQIQFYNDLKTHTINTILNQGIWDRPVEERIKPQYLEAILKEEFENRGIYSDVFKFQFHYGIYSFFHKSMVIADGHYVVSAPRNQEILAVNTGRNLNNPDYKVKVFTSNQPSPGELRVFFPNRNNIIWSSLWINFLWILVFALIILSCFGYTLTVIFRQKKLSEMKTDFINNMTHEFKTPIATISLAADSITSPVILSNSDKVKRFANIIKQENNRMNSQVEKVLQMALLDKRDFSLKLTSIDLHDVIATAVENISLQVEKKEGTVKAVLDAKNPVVEGDLTHISNMISNLLDNANKYSPDKPDITVITRNVPNGVEVTVKDKGIGMSKEARKQIFDKFYRVSTGNLHDVKGFGLGLSYVKAMIIAHKGQVDVKSELGKGSSFMLTFPFNVES
jgi:two-component system, OmpR family, phosphate regulon sensor histidine kinase PhoR